MEEELPSLIVPAVSVDVIELRSFRERRAPVSVDVRRIPFGSGRVKQH